MMSCSSYDSTKPQTGFAGEIENPKRTYAITELIHADRNSALDGENRQFMDLHQMERPYLLQNMHQLLPYTYLVCKHMFGCLNTFGYVGVCVIGEIYPVLRFIANMALDEDCWSLDRMLSL